MATNGVASRPPEHRPTRTLHARAKIYNTRKLGIVMGIQIDIFDLYMAVLDRGVFKAVTDWIEIGVQLGVAKTNMTGSKLKTFYEKALFDFEMSENLF